jgi:hypothetical protein
MSQVRAGPRGEGELESGAGSPGRRTKRSARRGTAARPPRRERESWRAMATSIRAPSKWTRRSRMGRRRQAHDPEWVNASSSTWLDEPTSELVTTTARRPALENGPGMRLRASNRQRGDAAGRDDASAGPTKRATSQDRPMEMGRQKTNCPRSECPMPGTGRRRYSRSGARLPAQRATPLNHRGRTSFSGRTGAWWASSGKGTAASFARATPPAQRALAPVSWLGGAPPPRAERPRG